jgi:hypothetical protein
MIDHESLKEQHGKRIQQKKNYVKKQEKIAKEFGLPVDEPHRLSKVAALNCGNPNCIMCSNPRKVWGELTIQEKRHLQEVDILEARHRHWNGIDNKGE